LDLYVYSPPDKALSFFIDPPANDTLIPKDIAQQMYVKPMQDFGIDQG
jgi:hypothetical protein